MAFDRKTGEYTGYAVASYRGYVVKADGTRRTIPAAALREDVERALDQAIALDPAIRGGYIDRVVEERPVRAARYRVISSIKMNTGATGGAR